MALKAGLRGLRSEARWLRADYRARAWRTARGRLADGLGAASASSLRDEQPLQNWRGQGESDCLIKTKHCEGLNRC